MRTSTATVYDEGPFYDIIAPSSSGGVYQILGFKTDDALEKVIRRKLEIGVYCFEPGQIYERFGSNRKTSAGFVCYDGEPIVFVGTFLGHALFQSVARPFSHGKYVACFWAWKYHRRSSMFVSVTSACAGRIMELDRLPEGEREWKP